MTDLPGPTLHVEFVRPDGLTTPLTETLQTDVRQERDPSDETATQVTVRVRNAGDRPVTGGIRVRLAMSGVAEPWWLIPGLFYGENRPVDCDVAYPRFAATEPADPQTMVSNAWSFRADRAATPAVFGWGGHAGMALVAEETSELGMSGLGFTHHDEDGDPTAEVHVTFPYREEPVVYDGSATPAPAEASTWTWHPGQSTTVCLQAHTLTADRHGYAPILRRAHARGRRAGSIRPWVGVPEAADLAAYGLHRWHYDPDPGVLLETVAFDRGVHDDRGRTLDRQAMHVGWISGIPWAYALLAHARRLTDAEPDTAARYREAGTRVVDLVCDNLAPCGTFWGRWDRERGWTQSWTPLAGALHARTLGEATLFLLRALALGDGAGAAHPAWVRAARGNLDHIASRQRADGNLGAAHHAVTGDVLSWTGAAGLTSVAALCEAADLDDDGRYLAAARRAGEYYARFVEAEFVHGAPEDVDLAPSSEDGYAAVMAYVALHRRTGEERWLDLARRAADWMLTFRYTYDVTFDARTTLGRHRFTTRGADQASPPNQHLHAYGLVCTREMLELAAATGEEYYAERALEHLACFRQMLPRVDGELNGYRGMVTERYYQTRCFQPKGMLLTLSHAWSAGVLLLGCEQAIAAGRVPL